MENRKEGKYRRAGVMYLKEGWFKNAVNPAGEPRISLRELRVIRKIMNSVNDPVIVQRPDLTVEICNDAACKMLGAAADKVKGKKCHELMPGGFDCSSCPVIKALETMEPAFSEKCLLEGKGRIQFCSTPIIDSKNNPIRIVSHLKDINELSSNKNMLQISQVTAINYLQNAADIIFVVTDDGSIKYISPNVEELTGYSAVEPLEDKFKEIIRPQDMRKLYKAVVKIVREYEEYGGEEENKTSKPSTECWIKNKSGQWRRMGIRISVIGRKEGRYELGGIARDITERKRMEEALKENKEKFRFIINNITDAVMETDSEGTITYASPSHRKVFGRDEDPVGHTTFKYIHPKDVEKVKQVFMRGMDTGEAEKIEYRFHHPEKGYIWLEAMGKRYFDANGNKKSLVTVRDINERKQAEEKIRYLSFHDYLTGLYNRAYLEEEIKRLDTERQLPISIIMMDVNALKLINDAYGHEAGDKLLVSAAEVLIESCRKEDIIARWGGDEFIVLLPQTPVQEAQKISNRIKSKCREVNIKSIQLYVALGSSTKEKIEENIYEVLKETEDRMYKNKLVEGESVRSDILLTLIHALGEKSFETEEHIRRMSKIAVRFGRELDMSEAEIDRLSLLVSLHDIGKIIIPEEILRKPEKLNDREWEIVKKHPETGYRIAKESDNFVHVAEEILAHHESWDGSGYPRGLYKDEIPFLARLIAIIDAFDVMTSGRPYQLSLSGEEAVKELERLAGTWFDPRLVNAFRELARKEHYFPE